MTKQYLFDAAGFLNGVYDGPAVKKNSTTLEPIYTAGFTPQFVDGAWLDQAKLPKIGPVQFKLLFTSAERLAIKEMRASNAALDDFFELVEDPRLTFVDLSLASVQQAIQYLVFLDLITPERATVISQGSVS